MQIVIEMDDGMYQDIKNCEFGFARQIVVSFQATITDAIRNGKPLPKGHGRLIDADAINTHDVSPIWDMEIYGVTEDDIDVEPTIIEADNGGMKNADSD